jgi:predicted TIM-barrel fold metal-dependent hydrolase
LLAEHTAHLQEEQRQAIMRENAAKLFQLSAGSESWRMNGAAA